MVGTTTRCSWQRTSSQIEILARPDAARAALADDLSLTLPCEIFLMCCGWNFRLRPVRTQAINATAEIELGQKMIRSRGYPFFQRCR
jgi:hypothetical protein